MTEEIINKQEEFEVYTPNDEKIFEQTDKAEDSKKIEKKTSFKNVFFYKMAIVLIIAIFYVLILTFVAPNSIQIKSYIKDKLTNDFSFSESVYKAVDTFSSYIEGRLNFDTDAKGGNANPVYKNEMPDNATFAPVIFTGKITFPLKNEYRVSSTFGFREHPISGENDFHTAVDLAAPKGTPVLATLNGKVIRAGKDASLGNFVKIEHKNGFYTIYGHCDEVLVKEGVYIRAEEVIAKVGSTGDSTGNHLHFGTQKDGLYFDPVYIFNWLYDSI